jgi:hypothetical protein
MTKELFDKQLEEDDISWNDNVNITIINPFRKWWEFWKPKTYTLKGLLNYTVNDDIVSLYIKDNYNCYNKLAPLYLTFDYNMIVNIKLVNYGG